MTRINRVALVARTAPRLAKHAWSTRPLPPLSEGFDRIYLHHIRKTGGTSVASAVLSLGGEAPREVERRLAARRPRVTRTGDIVVAAHDRIVLQSPWYTFGWSHVPAWQVRLRPRTFTVTILRDPVARVLSLYRYLLDPDTDQGHAFGAPQAERALATEGFDRFLDLIPAPMLLSQVHTFSPRLDPSEAAENISRCSLSFGIDEMVSGLERLSAILGRPLSERAERRSTVAFDPSEAQLDRLRHAVDPEYELMARLQRNAESNASTSPVAKSPLRLL